MIELDYNKSTQKLLIKGDSDVFSQIREYFSVPNEVPAFVRRRYRHIASRKYIITPTGQCDLGLYWQIRQFLIAKSINIPVILSETLQKALEPPGIGEVFTGLTYELRDYQYETVKNSLKVGRGLCILGTGAGKTLTTASLIENFYRNCANPVTFKCLLVVPDLGLVKQTYDELNLYGITYSTTKWTGSDTPDMNSNVIICNTGVLCSRFDTEEWVKYVDLLVVDEVHKAKHGNELSKIVSKVKTHRKFGFTGTLPQDKLEVWSLYGKFGPVLYEKPSVELREEKFLTNVEINILGLHYNAHVPKLTDSKYRDELEFITNNEQRNTLLYKLCNKLTNNTLILVNQIVHGEVLYETLSKDTTKAVFFISGSMEVADRDKIKQIMETSDNVVCIAISAIFSTGVNIKNIHNIIFASGGKSFIRTVQSIGRGLRLHESKSLLNIYDIRDELEYGRSHSDKRKDIYKKEHIKFIEKSIKLT